MNTTMEMISEATTSTDTKADLIELQSGTHVHITIR